MAKEQQTRLRIAAAAARLMAEDGIDDFALAKRKAARQLGLGDSQALPANEEVEAQLRAFRNGERANDAAKMMRTIAAKMSDAEIKAVSDYAAGLK